MNFDLKIQFQPRNYLYFLILQKIQIQHVPSNRHGASKLFVFMMMLSKTFIQEYAQLKGHQEIPP